MLDEVIRRYTADENASPFPDVDAAAWRELLVEAGFTSVRLRIGVGSARFPEPAEFLRRLGVSSPLAGTLATLDDAAYQALVSDLRQGLASHRPARSAAMPSVPGSSGPMPASIADPGTERHSRLNARAQQPMLRSRKRASAARVDEVGLHGEHHAFVVGVLLGVAALGYDSQLVEVGAVAVLPT